MIHPEIFEFGITTTPLVVGLFLIGLSGMVVGANMDWTGVLGIAKRVVFLALGGLTVFAPTPIAVGCMIILIVLVMPMFLGFLRRRKL